VILASNSEKAKGFYQIVVTAGYQPLYAVIHIGQSRQKDNGHLAFGCPQCLEYVQAVHPRCIGRINGLLRVDFLAEPVD
jgi:hypothetical protein